LGQTLLHHLKARTIKEDEKESDIVGYGIGSIILIINKILYYCLHLGLKKSFLFCPSLKPKLINLVLLEFPFRENAAAPFESKDNKG
jgi:hypothetical protein